MPASFINLIKELFMGFCLGTANIIPGVSGGTFLLIFNIYERVFSSLTRINPSVLRRAARLSFKGICAFGTRGTLHDIRSFLEENDFIFILKLLVGASAAIVALSSLMKFLLIHHFEMTYSLFFGLILVSIRIPFKMFKQYRPWLVIFILIGACLTVAVSWAVNPYEKVRYKSDHYQAQFQENDAKQIHTPADRQGLFSYTGKYTMKEYLYAAVCGTVAISAMVLPGISGSLVLILMGAYFDVISAISALKQVQMDTLFFLASFGGGIVLGGLLFARLLNFVLNRWYDTTMAFLMGLMAGSLYALWPFKKMVVMAEQYVKQDGMITVIENARIYTNVNILPAPDSNLVGCIVLFVVGGLIMSAFMKVDLSG